MRRNDESTHKAVAMLPFVPDIAKPMTATEEGELPSVSVRFDSKRL